MNWHLQTLGLLACFAGELFPQLPPGGGPLPPGLHFPPLMFIQPSLLFESRLSSPTI